MKNSKIIQWFLNKIKTYVGEIEYVVTIVNVSGEIQRHIFYNKQKIDAFVCEVNTEKYWCVQKIEKIRRYEFVYNHEIIHSPLWFNLDGVTEVNCVENNEFSYLIKDKSLCNIKRVKI